MSTSQDIKLLTVKEVAEMLSISERTLWSLTNAGDIPRVRIRNRVRYRLDHVQGFIDKQTEGDKK